MTAKLNITREEITARARAATNSIANLVLARDDAMLLFGTLSGLSNRTEKISVLIDALGDFLDETSIRLESLIIMCAT